ncbi:arylsulfotransferase family protein [Salinirubrum litoreum]|uniref:Arylsulfotransferase family protein n=1 Tax=Salinirubrum litoreum TaxID=1126234 RepID=A0ABD5RD59_9EURY|nr:arylsulfotransferase family protein [Salinirubrum litoreum]
MRLDASLGKRLVVVGIVLLVGTFVVSAALAPDRATVGADSGEQTLVGIHGGGPGLHEDGAVELVQNGSVVWETGDTDSYFDVTRLDNGSVLAGFMHSGYDECGPYEAPCTRTGFRVIDPNDGDPQIVGEYSFPVRTETNSEVHDVERLPGGGYLFTDMEYERIAIVEQGEIVWQWNASSFYEAPPDPTRTDWLHINDVDRIGEDRYLVSVRNANQLVIVERGEGVVDVINEDPDPSDGRVGDPDLMDHQHNPQWLGEGAVLVADSENNRIVELHEQADGSWEIVWSVSSADGYDFRWPRDADRLPNGNTLITDSAGQRVVEVNESGAMVWSYVTPGVFPYEAERLPAGETVGAPTYGGDPMVEATGGVPLLTPAVNLLRNAMPLPYWIAETQLFTTLLSLGLVGVGAVLARRD